MSQGLYEVNREETLDSRVRNALGGLAICDALGAPLEFQARRQRSSQYVRDMLPNENFDLPAGHFTDDTSMALCLAHSLISNAGKTNAVDQAARYVSWLDEGYMSSLPGRAFDKGVQTYESLEYWRNKPELRTIDLVRVKFDQSRRCGNGSLMRVLPCALIARSEDEAIELGKESSLVTHPHLRCVDACGLYSCLVWRALRGSTKETLIERLKDQVGGTENELQVRLRHYNTIADFRSKPRESISSSGYVVDSLEAALWAFFTTDTFEAGAIEVVNLGDDADTVGAIFGGLAGAYYGSNECIPERWLKAMQRFDLVTDCAQQLVGGQKL